MAPLTYLKPSSNVPHTLQSKTTFERPKNLTGHFVHAKHFNIFAFLTRNFERLGSKFSYHKVCMNETSDLVRRGHVCVRNEGLAFSHACGHFCASAFHSTDSEKRETARSLTSDQRAMNTFQRGNCTYLVVRGRHFVHLRMWFMIEIAPNYQKCKILSR